MLLRNMHIKRMTVDACVVLALCFALASGSDLQAEVLEEVSHVLGESSFYTCKQPQGTLGKSICSCDTSCNRYGDCCIDNAEDVPLERHMCTRLASHGPHVRVKASCGGRRVPSWMKERCEGEFTGDFPDTSYQFNSDIPSFHKPSGVLYRNTYCVECNGGRRDEAYNWRSKLDWVGPSPGNVSASSQRHKMMYNAERGVYWMKHEGITYNATVQSAVFGWKNFTQTFNTTECSPVVNTCPKGSDPVLAQKCALYAAYYTPNDTVEVTYKNYHCALCNGVSRTTVEQDGELAKFIHSVIIPSRRKPASFTSSAQLGGKSYFQLLLDLPTPHTGCGEGQIRVPGLNCCQAFGCEPGAVKYHDGCRGNSGTYADTYVVLTEQQVTILPNYSLYSNLSGISVKVNEYERDSFTGLIVARVPHHAQVVPDPILEKVAEVSLGFSIIFLLALIVLYVVSPDRRASRAGRAVLPLLVSTEFAQVLLLASKHIQPYTIGCSVVAVFLHYSYLASSFWMTVLVYRTCHSILTGCKAVDAVDGKHPSVWKSVGTLWMWPVLVVEVGYVLEVFLPEATLSPNYGGHLCWISSQGGLIAFFGFPIGVLMVFNLALITLTVEALKSSGQRGRDDRRIASVIALAPVCGLPWLFGVVAALTSEWWLWYTFTVLQGIQGVLLFVVFVRKKSVISDRRRQYLSAEMESGQETSGPASEQPESSPMLGDEVLPTAASNEPAQSLLPRLGVPVDEEDTKAKASTESQC
ncbi:uncharacterized protein LOC135393527 [Ornithodoros turicata]|uniref:uncharacterized protein LOC135393527 n=1 Tax=Ornithodoros turicata TaxID=34597 RepID=UPI0031394120